VTADVLIVGQGVAGSVLAQTLDAYGLRVVLANAPDMPSASAAAAGIVNPLTGRNLVRTWQADALFPFLFRFYADAERRLGGSFFRPMPIYRPYRSEAEKTAYARYTAEPDVAQYVARTLDSQLFDGYIEQPFGGLTVGQSGWLLVGEYVEYVKRHFLEKKQYLTQYIDPNQLTLSGNSVRVGADVYGNVIFCDGVQAQQNRFFSWLPYNPVKGQLLTVRVRDFPTEAIVNQGAFILPMDRKTLKIGATYTWHDLDWQTSDDGRAFLQNKVAGLLRVPYEIVGQQAGIRPATRDRRPFVGWHPAHPMVGIFGGMGSKGVSLAPYLAHELARHLLRGDPLDDGVNISRYRSLYEK
jgi:glycine/D-amino acid oxidase-like deaminating enzyme